MTAAAMAQVGYSSHKPHGWMASMLVHVVAVTVSLFVFAELKPEAQKEPFRWEIALAQVTPPTQPVTHTPAPAKPKPVVQPTPLPPKPVEAQPVVQRVQTVQPVENVQPIVRQEQVVVQNRVNPIVETIAQHAEPIHQEQQAVQTTEVLQKPEAVQTAEVVQKIEAVESTPMAAVSTPSPVSQPAPVNQVVQSDPTPVTWEVTAQHPAPITTSEPVMAQASEPVQQAAVSQSSVETVEAPAPVQQTAHAAPAAPQAVERPAVVTAPVKADYSWLTQELLSRLERSKRYPYAARMNRWEGRVIVKAVVRDDGQVVSLQIAESSGHAILDNDAMELIRQVSPIRLKYPLGKTQVALLVPVGYSLR